MLFIKPNIKGSLHTDEKQMKVGKTDYYDINTIDRKTKFIVEEEFMKSRTKQKVNEYFKRIKQSIYNQLLMRYRMQKNKYPRKKNTKLRLYRFYSDGFENYGNAAKKYFGRVCNITTGVPIKAKAGGLKHNNNHIEKYNQDIDDRYKTTRHWGSFESSKDILKMRQIIHNFINPHMELKGKTPAEKADIKINLGKNKLLNLIRFVHMPKT